MPNHLTPTELAREFGLARPDVISSCMAWDIPIFQGRIDKRAFAQALEAHEPDALRAPLAAHFVLFDSSGNMIDSFERAHEARRAASELRAASGSNKGHFSVVAYDAHGDVIDPRSPAPARLAH